MINKHTMTETLDGWIIAYNGYVLWSGLSRLAAETIYRKLEQR